MPELHFQIEWPDREVTTHYSPSTIVRNYFTTGRRFTVEELKAQCTDAFGHADERVQARYGYSCSGAAASLQAILERASRYRPEEQVTILDVG